jgi:DNA-binding transcriptional regulator YhcF (GntR family)
MNGMRFDTPLDDAFRSGSHVKVLRVLALPPPNYNLSGRELAKRARISHPRASKVLADMAGQGLVSTWRGSGYALHELNTDHILARVLRRLFEAEQDIPEHLLSFLSEGIAQRSQHVRAALVYGPAAWADPGPDGDVHLAVLCAPERDLEVEVAMHDLAEQFRRVFGNHLTPLVETRRRAIELARQGRQPWRRISVEGIPVFGRFPR